MQTDLKGKEQTTNSLLTIAALSKPSAHLEFVALDFKGHRLTLHYIIQCRACSPEHVTYTLQRDLKHHMEECFDRQLWRGDGCVKVKSEKEKGNQ